MKSGFLIALLDGYRIKIYVQFLKKRWRCPGQKALSACTIYSIDTCLLFTKLSPMSWEKSPIFPVLFQGKFHRFWIVWTPSWIMLVRLGGIVLLASWCNNQRCLREQDVDGVPTHQHLWYLCPLYLVRKAIDKDQVHVYSVRRSEQETRMGKELKIYLLNVQVTYFWNERDLLMILKWEDYFVSNPTTSSPFYALTFYIAHEACWRTFMIRTMSRGAIQSQFRLLHGWKYVKKEGSFGSVNALFLYNNITFDNSVPQKWKRSDERSDTHKRSWIVL